MAYLSEMDGLGELSGYFERDGFLIERDRWVTRGREAGERLDV